MGKEIWLSLVKLKQGNCGERKKVGKKNTHTHMPYNFKLELERLLIGHSAMPAFKSFTIYVMVGCGFHRNSAASLSKSLYKSSGHQHFCVQAFLCTAELCKTKKTV